MASAGAATLEQSQVSELVLAAGGVVVRPAGAGWEVAVVHRPGREDWSFPKGKLEPEESFEEAAVREVLEETGLRCALDRFLGHTHYRDRKERPKVVAYWQMHPESGEFRPNGEVDELRWVSAGQALQILTYERDRDLLNAAGLPGHDPEPTGTGPTGAGPTAA